jgi:hypothetical protein
VAGFFFISSLYFMDCPSCFLSSSFLSSVMSCLADGRPFYVCVFRVFFFSLLTHTYTHTLKNNVTRDERQRN